MQKLAFDEFKTDELTVIEDSDCCLKVNAVISRVGVYDYPEGKALKSRMELLRAARAARYAGAALYVAETHPDSLLVMSPDDVHGGIEKPFFDRDRIRAVLNFDKKKCQAAFLDKVRSGNPLDVSIGFHYRQDWTPGVDVDVNTGKQKPYDFVMRDIKIDHVACGVIKGRCSYPQCGIGLDSLMQTAKVTLDMVQKMGDRIGLDPFGEYVDFQDCVQKNEGKQADPEAFCAWLHHEVTGKWPGEAALKSRVSDMTEQPKPKPKGKDQEDTPYQACVTEKTESGMTPQEAEEACKDLKPAEDTKPPVETPPPPPPPAEAEPEPLPDAAAIIDGLDKKLLLKKTLKS